jgi:glutaredoxin
MLTKIQLLQTATLIAMTIGTFATSVVRVQADPSQPSRTKQTISSGQTPVGNPTNTPATTPTNTPAKLPATTVTPTTVAPKVETVSGKAETALAQHLLASGAKFYGAYWCSHCQKQKSLFGATAAASLPYIECAADGENSQRQLCKDKNIKMFPTWVIGGQYFTGTKELKEIAALTGYKGPMNFKSKK